MFTLIKDNVITEISGQVPPPSKDFVSITITTEEFIWRYWKINPHCLRPDVKVAPTETKETHHDFLHDLDSQSEVKRTFGDHTLEYVKGICSGHFDYFQRISEPLQIYILSFMELEDIGHLSQTNKHFHQLCNSEQLWEHIVERHCDTVTEDMKQFASEVGWKHVFFTNKLQLQAQMRRHQQRALFTSQS